MTFLCQHYACRCARANELANMDMLQSAIAVHFQRVTCRQPAAPAPVLDPARSWPFPSEAR